jgi:hypothetical protein
LTALTATIAAAAAQLALGAALHAGVATLLARRGAGRGGLRRRWIVAWSRGARALVAALPWAAAALASLFALDALGPRRLGDLARLVWFDPAWFVLLGALPASGCYLIVHAGGLERRGRRRAARAQARLGGELAFVGVLVFLVFVWSGLLFRVPMRRALVDGSEGAGLYLLGGMIGLGGAAFVAVTGGLAGKPRPAGLVAALLGAAGIAGLVLAFQTAS